MTVLSPVSPRLALMLGLTTALGLAGMSGGALAQTATPTAPAATTVPPAATPTIPSAASTTTPPEVPASGTTAPGTTAPGTAAPKHAYSRKGHGMAGYLASLHEQLKITPAEEPLWTTFANTMQENARALGEAYRQRRSQLPSMNAVADMTSFINLEQLRLDGLKKSSTAFTALYETMPSDQQKLADKLFLSDMPGGPHPRKNKAAKP
ncbi:MAG: hypothetical protein HIU92_07275 [Proteobacteria bacterium]|nr:hypothetical protein [Pseudomonadota bacterium]